MLHRVGRFQRDLTFTEAIKATGLSAPAVLAATVLFLSYLLRMAIIPWPLPKTLTNYTAIVLACVTAFGLMKQVVPVYIMGLLLTLPSVFNSPNLADSGLRWIGWGLLYVAVGPILSGSKVFRFRMFIMVLFVGFMHLSAIGSGLAGFAGFQLGGGRGTFWGLLSHSNILGSVASVAALDSFAQWSRSCSGRSKTLWLCILILELSTSMRAASRAALLGFFVGGALLTLISNASTKRKLFVALVLGGCVVLGGSVIQKSESADFTGDESLIANLVVKGLENTREQLWQDRINEFQSSPLIGIGFCMGGPKSMRVNQDGFMQEPGSSYLAAVSMTGIVGLVGFFIMIWPLFSATYRMLRQRYGPYPPVYVYTSFYWLVAMIAEGFSHYVGSPFCFAVFLWSGVCFDSQNLYPNVNPLQVRFR